MSGTSVVLIAVVVVILLSVLFLFTTSFRRDRAAALRRAQEGATPTAEQEGPSGKEVERAAVLSRRGSSLVVVAPGGAPPAPSAPLDPEALGVTRRQFFNRSIVGFATLGLSAFGAATIGFLWPTLSGGFGAKIKVGKLDQILSDINTKREPYYVAEARTWLSAYPADAVSKASKVYNGAVLDGMKEGVVALYQKCVHLGCRVPWCKSSQWFECPCHGSKYNRVGEKKGGPAPRGLDRFGVQVAGGTVIVDTSKVIQGPPIGTNTTGQEAEGPHCA
ncbi:MAG TPA: Rieske 2Fe-2S domain-containing protein [Acidimicrobiales bacterium]|nr:Rieske 2Fe-2S domain-containing protein [Acidimicrobiales bacterium]